METSGKKEIIFIQQKIIIMEEMIIMIREVM